MGAGNYLCPFDQGAMFYVDIDSIGMDEFRQLKSCGEIDQDESYESFAQDQYNADLDNTISEIKSLARRLSTAGISAYPLDDDDQTQEERQEWIFPVMEVGLVRVAVKEIDINRLAVITYPTMWDETSWESDLCRLDAKEFKAYYGITRERYITANGLQTDTLDTLLITHLEDTINAVTAKTVSRRCCAWTSGYVSEVPAFGSALSAFKKAYRHGIYIPRNRKLAAAA